MVRRDLLGPDHLAVLAGAGLLLEQFRDLVATPVMDDDLLADAHPVEGGACQKPGLSGVSVRGDEAAWVFDIIVDIVGFLSCSAVPRGFQDSMAMFKV